jgi:hypothetical protein
MYVNLKGKSGGDDGGEEVAGEEATEEAESATKRGKRPASTERPLSWTFDGWYAFIIFGPFAPPNQAIDLLRLNDPNDGEKMQNGRAARQEIEAKEKEAQRSRDVGNPNNPRGISLKDRVAIASLDMQDNAQRQTQKETRLISVKMQMDCLQKQIDRAERKGDHGKVALLESQEKALMLQFAAVLAPTPEKEARTKTWIDLVDETRQRRQMH